MAFQINRHISDSKFLTTFLYYYQRCLTQSVIVYVDLDSARDSKNEMTVINPVPCCDIKCH